jgi:hypothetical protein
VKRKKNRVAFSAEKALHRAQQLYDILKINEKYAVPQLRYYISSLQDVKNYSFVFGKREMSLGKVERIRLNAVVNTNDCIADIARAMKKGTTLTYLISAERRLDVFMKREHEIIAVFRTAMQKLLATRNVLDKRDRDAAKLILNETVFAKNELKRIHKAFALLVAELSKKGGPKPRETVKMVVVKRRTALKHATLELDSCVSLGSVSKVKGHT